jgi:RHS repeat-associated protein
LTAYTARNTEAGAVHGESPRSNLVFWQWGVDGGYAQLSPRDAEEFDAIAEAASRPSEDLVCSVRPDVGLLDGPSAQAGIFWTRAMDSELSAVELAAQKPQPQLASMPMRSLGTLPADPPWVFFDLHTDHLGTVRLITDNAGTLVSRHDYYPFGEVMKGLASFNTHQFTGHERDSESGIDYMLARYYGSALPRFLSPDPLGGTESDPQSWNRYAYVRNNPIRLVDPTGMIWAPGTPMPILPGDPNGCTMCHDFDNGTQEQRDFLYAQQEKARVAASPGFKAWFKSKTKLDWDTEMSRGGGTRIDLDQKPDKKSDDAQTSPDGTIRLNVTRLTDPDYAQHVLAHEEGHRASTLSGYGLRGNDLIPPDTRAYLDHKYRNDKARVLLDLYDGYIGVAFEYMVFSRIMTYDLP